MFLKKKETRKLKSSKVKMPSSFLSRDQSMHGSGDSIARQVLPHRTPLRTQCPFTSPIWFYSSFDSLQSTRSNGNHGMTQLSQISQGGHSRHERTMPGYLGKEQSSPRTLFAQHTLLCLCTYSKSSAGLIEIVFNNRWHLGICQEWRKP